LLEEIIPVVYKKIESYDPYYRAKQGNLKPVKFVSYIWKRIDGFIIDYLKSEMKKSAVLTSLSNFNQVETYILPSRKNLVQTGGNAGRKRFNSYI